METILVFYNESFILTVGKESFINTLNEYKIKCDKLLAGGKFKSYSFWSFDEGAGGFKFLGVWCSKQVKVTEAVFEQDRVILAAHQLALDQRIGKKNLPIFLSIYQPIGVYVNFDAKAYRQAYRFDVKGKDFGLGEIFKIELGPVAIGEELAIFSKVLYPNLRGFDITKVKIISCKPTNEKLKTSHQKRYIKGHSLKGDRLSIALLVNEQAWTLELFPNGEAWLISTADIKNDIGELTGFDFISSNGYQPKIIADPSNVIVNELYKIICLIDEQDAQSFDISLGNHIQMLLSSFVEKANSNAVSLFPALEKNDLLRASVIEKTVEEFKKIPIKNQLLYELLKTTLSTFTALSNEKDNKMKKPKTSKTPPPTTEGSTFRPSTPYLQLSYPQGQRDGPLNAKNNSLLAIYWKVRNGLLEKDMEAIKRFWQ